jgi:hemin uptake protein HemP
MKRLIMAISAPREALQNSTALRNNAAMEQPITRINSRDLFRQMREVEIAHEGRIYRLRLTQLNKLILTA